MSETSIAKTVYWQPLHDMLDPARSKTQTLAGFDEEFVDLADYILRITHRIWEQKNIGACYDYYSEYCPVHTLGGYADSVDVVVQNTLKTIAAFPDRSLIGEDVIYREEANDVYYSSHRITSIMTNKGPSEFGAPTGKTGRVTTIADCMCRDNKIFYEWLMRDNSFLIAQLGIELDDAAAFQAKFPVSSTFTQWLNEEYARTCANEASRWEALPEQDKPWGDFAKSWADQIFNKRMFNKLSDFYKPNASVQWPGGRQATGNAAIGGMFIKYLASCPDANMVVDHICVTHYDDNRVNIALRWGLAGHYNATQSKYAQFNQQPHYILGATHFEIEDGVIAKEFTVFDEVAALANLMRKLPQATEA